MGKWYKLDNVGILYASTSSRRVPNVFRYSAKLTEDIDEKVLQQALEKTIIVYPNFNVNMKKGVYWYYLEEVAKAPKVQKERLPICYRIYNNADDFLYRVTYFENKINFEITHILSDGRGSVQFFQLLVSNYIKIKKSLNVDLIVKNSELEKTEDSFEKYYSKKAKNFTSNSKLYRYKEAMLKDQIRYMECHLNSKQVLEMAHKYNTTLTIFLIAVLIYSFKDILKTKDYNKAIKIDVPVDLRKFFKSSSTRNFFGLVFVEYKFHGDDTLEEIIEELKKQFEEKITPEKLAYRMNMMMSFEKNIILKFVPLLLKNIILRLINHYISKMNTSCFSNLGIISFEPEIEKYIEKISIVTSTDSFQFVSCSFKENLTIGISSVFKNNDVIKNFCRFFSQNGLEVNIDVSEVE